MLSSTSFSPVNGRIKTYSHRRQSRSFGQVMSFVSSYFGDLLYYIGLSVERQNMHSRRRLKRFFKSAAHNVGIAFSAVGKTVGSLCARVATDLFMPVIVFVRMLKNSSSLSRANKELPREERVSARKAYFQDGFARNKYVISRFFNLVLPCSALVCMIIVVSTFMNLQYGLQINIGNKIIGYVENEEDFTAAKRIIDERMVLDSTAAYWMSDAVYYLSVVNENRITTQEELANRLLIASGEDITQATGLYIGGVFIGATTEGDGLREQADALIAKALDSAQKLKDPIITFERDVEFVDGIFLTSSLKEPEYFASLVSGEETPELVYRLLGYESVEDVAKKNGITVAQLQALNPDTDLTQLVEGDRLIVSDGESTLFSVRTVILETTTEAVEYEFITLTDSRYKVGYYQLMQEGKNGRREIVTEYEYKDGKLVGSKIISNTIVQQPIPYTVLIGIKTSSGSKTAATGILIFPTAARWWNLTRGWIPNVHYGLDIAIAEGNRVLAADNGYVQFFGVSGGYGNLIIINHGNGMTTFYAHLSYFMSNLKIGGFVAKGQTIGLSGNTGNSTGPHLHFEVRLQGKRVDPWPWVTKQYTKD